jgi:hypothetical protein
VIRAHVRDDAAMKKCVKALDEVVAALTTLKKERIGMDPQSFAIIYVFSQFVETCFFILKLFLLFHLLFSK